MKGDFGAIWRPTGCPFPILIVCQSADVLAVVVHNVDTAVVDIDYFRINTAEKATTYQTYYHTQEPGSIYPFHGLLHSFGNAGIWCRHPHFNV